MPEQELSNFLIKNAVWLDYVIWLVIIWSLIWKGMALWKAARNSDKIWFIILLIINTVGILEILYIFVFSKKKR
jgi:hypothetical protein